MSTRLHRHATLLRTLQKATTRKRRQLLHKHCDDDFVCCIVECVRNLLKGNVPLNSHQKKRLQPKKKVLRQLILKKTSQRKRRQLVQSGGFLGALLGPIVSVLGSLFGNGTR